MSHSNKILYLSYDGLTDSLGQSQILPYLNGLASRGFSITIISFEKHDIFNEKKASIESILHANLNWKPLPYHKWPPVFSTLWDLGCLWREVKKECNDGRYAIIHCRSYITSLIGLRAKRKLRIKFIFDMRGFWADERVEGGLWNLSNPVYRMVYRYFKTKERQFLQEADHIVSLTENAKKEILSWNCTTAPIVVIPTCVDLELFDRKKILAEDQIRLRTHLGIGLNDFVLLYLGSWGTWYLTREMLNFFSVLKEQRPDAKFLIVTPDRIELKDYPYKSSVIVTRASRQEVPLFISIADASLFFIKPTFSKKASSATKMGEIMAMGVPWVTNAGWGDVGSVAGQNSSIILNDFNALAIRSSVNTLVTGRFEHVPIDSRSPLSLSFGVHSYEKIWDSVMVRSIS